MGTFTVKTFGILAEKLDRQEVEHPFCDNTEELKQNLFNLYPQLRELNFSLAVDKELVHGNTPLKGNEEIALLPPFSGG